MKTVINQGLRELSGNGFFPGGQGAGASTIALVPLQKSITLQTALATTIDSYINQGNCFLGITNNGHTQVVKVLNKNKVTPGTTYFLDQPLSELFIEDVFDVAVFGEPKFQYEKIEVSMLLKKAGSYRIGESSAAAMTAYLAAGTSQLVTIESDRPIAYSTVDTILAWISKYK